jgi:hypothetical protein
MAARFSFADRIFLLLGLMAIAALIDHYRNGKKASRFREYGFVLLTGLIGAVVGFANDLVTCSISPDYFVLGKGLATGDGLRWRAGIYGAQAGLAAGIIGGAVCLFTAVRKSADLTAQLLRLAKALWVPLAAAIVVAAALPILARDADPFQFGADLEPLLNPGQIARFLWVWWMHTGLYTGMFLGLVALILRHRLATED